MLEGLQGETAGFGGCFCFFKAREWLCEVHVCGSGVIVTTHSPLPFNKTHKHFSFLGMIFHMGVDTFH